jgi:hypothetical protein
MRNVSDFEIQYAAHTATCTFFLDGEGICRRVMMVSKTRNREAARSAARCVGAQYVASLDPTLSGMLSDMPKVGISMLFARTDERGRISLVRTGHVTRFERHVEEDPFGPSGVATSAPPLSPSVMPTPRRERESMLPPPDPYDDGERLDDRTRALPAVRSQPRSDIRELAPLSADPPTIRVPLVGPPPRRSDVAPRPGVSVQKPAIRRRG